MMCISDNGEKYEEFKRIRFEKYIRKVEAIRMNIDQTSMMASDMKELKNKLAKILTEDK